MGATISPALSSEGMLNDMVYEALRRDERQRKFVLLSES